MPGNYQKYLDEYGICECSNPSGDRELMSLESKDERTGRWTTKNYPACADCFGLRY
jgi:hypothetical protein